MRINFDINKFLDDMPEKLRKKVLKRLLAFYKMIAITGKYSDECMEEGFLPVAVHFYQPIPDIKELEERNVWDKKSSLNGIDFNSDSFITLLNELSEFSSECVWPDKPTGGESQFYLDNNCFSYGCASALHCLIRKYKPKRIIEVGSGNSSRVINVAINMNLSEGFEIEDYTIIDPYSILEQEFFHKNTRIIKKQVEHMDTEFFTKLEENDILFIDSSHVCKIGSDVNFEILDVLPLLKKGVLIHFHDICLPAEYPKIYATNPSFRMFWTEQYLLQAFLCCNNKFKTILPMHYIQSELEETFREKFPGGDNVKNWMSGSYWIKKVE